MKQTISSVCQRKLPAPRGRPPTPPRGRHPNASPIALATTSKCARGGRSRCRYRCRRLSEGDHRRCGVGASPRKHEHHKRQCFPLSRRAAYRTFIYKVSSSVMTRDHYTVLQKVGSLLSRRVEVVVIAVAVAVTVRATIAVASRLRHRCTSAIRNSAFHRADMQPIVHT